MCVSPVKIPNPYFTCRGYEYREGDYLPLDSRFVSHKPFIEVPCGKCADCRNSYVMSLLQRVQMESLTSYVFFITLTYDDEHLPSISFTSEPGRTVSVYYSDRTHVQLLMKRLRDEFIFKGRDFRYLAVTEYGTTKFRPHHHLLFFVAKKKDDPPYTALHLESALWHLIKSKYGTNVGTRKNPIYEPLFTYARRYNHKKQRWEANYDVTLVRDKSKPIGDLSSFNSVDSVQASASYILSYLNKPSVYDSLLEPFLDEMRSYLSGDLLRRLCSILKCRCYYSKHLGFGFYDDGSKVVPTPRSFTLTEDTLSIAQELRELPPSWCDFSSLYPDLAHDVYNYSNTLLNYFDDFCSKLSLSEFFETQTPYSNYLFRLVHKYFPGVVKSFILTTHAFQADYYPTSLPVRDYDIRYKSSKTYKYIRSSIDQGLSQRVPYLAFSYIHDGKVRFTSLCKYFRRYVTTSDDVRMLYDSLGVSNFDEYLSLFEHSHDSYLRHCRAQLNNRDKHPDEGREDLTMKNSSLFLFNLGKKHIFVPTASSIRSLMI